MGTSPPVRSVARAIEVLRAMNLHAVSTVDALYAHTRIPKPTIIRLLRTFETQGLVQHGPQHGAYCLRSGVRELAAGYHSEPAVVEAAAPVLDELTVRIKWPLGVAVHDRHAMVVRYSTIPLSPLALRHSTINMRLSLVTRAMGRAWLAFCTPDERQAQLQALAQSEDPEDHAARDGARMHRLLDGIQAAGYALRDPTVWPTSHTVAVPVFNRDGVAASMGLTFFTSAMTPEQAVARYLDDLLAAAERIGERLRALPVHATA